MAASKPKFKFSRPFWMGAFILIASILWLLQEVKIIPTTLPLGPLCAIIISLELLFYSLE